MGDEESWDGTVDEWLISEGYCSAGALAQGSDAFFYAAAPVAGEAGWALVYKEDHEQDIMQEDMTEKKMTINEPTNLKFAVENGKAPPSKLWLGGEKYAVTQYNAAEEIAEKSCTYLFANKPKKGVHIVKTPGDQIIAGFYSEEKGQSPGNARKAVIAFAEYLIGIGY